MFEITALDSLLMKAFQENYKYIIEIKRNDPCPCGSGLKFKHCHIESDNQWEKGFEFYDGNFSYENVSLTLELLNTIREILSKLKSHNSIDEKLGLELLEKLYSTYDPAIEQLQKNAPCKKGCIACCFQEVKLQKIEAQRINIHMNSKIKKVIKSNLRETKARKKFILHFGLIERVPLHLVLFLILQKENAQSTILGRLAVNHILLQTTQICVMK